MRQSRFVLVVYKGGYPSNEPPRVVRIVSCETDAEYFSLHRPTGDGERGYLVRRAEFELSHPPNLAHGRAVYRIQKNVEERLARRA